MCVCGGGWDVCVWGDVCCVADYTVFAVLHEFVSVMMMMMMMMTYIYIYRERESDRYVRHVMYMVALWIHVVFNLCVCIVILHV